MLKCATLGPLLNALPLSDFFSFLFSIIIQVESKNEIRPEYIQKKSSLGCFFFTEVHQAHNQIPCGDKSKQIPKDTCVLIVLRVARRVGKKGRIP